MKVKNWMGKTFEITLREDRTLTEFGDYGVKRKLPDMMSTDAVFWSPRFNSYVACLTATNDSLDGHANFGEARYVVVSINGIGEIRWVLETDPTQYFGDPCARLAIDYFFEVKEV